ncbi:hypothetical protein Ahy_A09g044480 [Arachis hypogaea]|uniref:Aminotransferase-like plant mobile domain-containing protein n=1 Tax=Arachis hypogaea TaxID=3818 RepID=A0A445BK58_ARAHY|nr:hypothetical protein Ahy_A09g044480 [Arachis hypogaea]
MASSSSQTTTQDKGKGHEIVPSSPQALCILNQVNDEVIDDPHLPSKDSRILITFTIGAETHCSLGPIESLEKANKKLSFFPSAKGEDLLINQSFNISHFINKKTFRNNPKISPRGYDFIAWYWRLEPTKNADWKSSGIHELLRLSHFSLTTHPWMIGAVTCFWNRTTNNFHLPCGMIGISLLDVAAITGLLINSPDCTPDMQSKRQYNVVMTNPYSDFIAHNMDFDNDQLNFTPFLRRNRGPVWLDRLLFPDTNEENDLANRSWTNMLALQVIPTGLPLHKKEKFKITLYAPNMTARQFGLSQAIPTPQPRNDEPFCHFALTIQEDFDSCLLKNQQRRGHFNFMVYDRSFYITKSYFEWWATYYSRYTRTLEEIKQTAIHTIPVAEGSPKRTQKRKTELVLLTSSKSADESEPTNKNAIIVSSPSEGAVDSDPGSQLVLRSRLSQPVIVTHSTSTAGILDQSILPQQHGQEQSTSHDSIQFTRPTQTIPATFPPISHTTQVIDSTTNPLQHSPEETHRLESTSPNDRVVFSEENQAVPDSDSASKAGDTTNSDSSRSTFQLQETENEEAVAQLKIDNILVTAQPIQASREEFDLRISHDIYVQAFHDQEEARLETELAQIQKQLATIHQNRATIAKHLAAAQQEQHILIQKLVSLDTEQGEYEKQLEKIQADKFKQIEVLTTLENKRTKQRSDLAKLLAP